MVLRDWPQDIRSLRMPWYDSEYIDPDQQAVGVFLHIFYPELAEELARTVANIPVPVRVYISTDTEEKRAHIANVFGRAGFADQHEIRVLPNRGWDIAPFLVGFADRIREHEVILHMHGKRSGHLSEELSSEWRNLLLSSLAGSPERVRSILAAFSRCRSLGMVCPEHWHVTLPQINAAVDSEDMNRLLAPFGCSISPTDIIDFPSGSMFWARSKALEPLLSQNFSWYDFDPVDSSKRWSTLPHAVERTFFFMCAFAGLQWSRVPQLGVPSNPAPHVQSPGVSILLTSYNYARYIGTTITSILSQTWTNWELIVIDDGSTDDSIEVIESFAREESRITLLRHPDGGNHGLAASLRCAMEHAQHEIVAFIESDDYWHENHLAAHVQAMQAHDAGVTYCTPACVAQPGGQARLAYFQTYILFCEKYMPHQGCAVSLRATLRRRNIIPTMSCVVAKRSLCANCDWNPPVAPWLDWWLWMQVSDARFFRVPEKYAFWRVHAKSYHSEQKQCDELKKQYSLMYEAYALKSGTKINRLYNMYDNLCEKGLMIKNRLRNVCRKLNVRGKLYKIKLIVKKIIKRIRVFFDILLNGGTVFMCNYPFPELNNGYFQRLRAVDLVFSSQWRIYYNIEYHSAGHRFIELPAEKALYVNAGSTMLRGLLLLLCVMRCRRVYFHSILRLKTRWQRIVMRMPFVKKIWDVHGAVPEETAFQGNGTQAKIYEKHEALAASQADVILVVSNAMGRHLCNKYDSGLEDKIVLLPIISEYKTLADREKEHDEQLPKVIYAGGVDIWQQIPLMLNTIAAAYNRASWHIFTQEPEAFRALMPEELKGRNIPIQTASRGDLLRMYPEYSFGFVLRDGNILNVVSCPTKLVEYVAMGVIPILDEVRIGDFADFGLQYVTKDDFIAGRIPGHEERQKMREANVEVYSKIYSQYLQGLERLKDATSL